MIKKLSGLIILLLMASSCATRAPMTKFHLAPDLMVELPSPLLEKEVRAQQLLTTTINKKELVVLALFDATKEGIQFLALTPVGVKLFKIAYTEQGIEVEQYISMVKLPEASEILSDIMFAYFPISVWETKLPEGWRLLDQEKYRFLTNDRNESVLTITYADRKNERVPISIVHHTFNYKIKLKNLDE